jgi:hypothetical protein
MATALQFGLVTLPFAAVAAWRTWIHAKRRCELGTSGWQGVGEAGGCGLVAVLILLGPAILSHPTLAMPLLLVYGAFAVLIGLLIGTLLRGTAVMVLKLTESAAVASSMTGDARRPAGRRASTTNCSRRRASWTLRFIRNVARAGFAAMA